jgi:hypothetical protein
MESSNYFLSVSFILLQKFRFCKNQGLLAPIAPNLQPQTPLQYLWIIWQNAQDASLAQFLNDTRTPCVPPLLCVISKRGKTTTCLSCSKILFSPRYLKQTQTDEPDYKSEDGRGSKQTLCCTTWNGSDEEQLELNWDTQTNKDFFFNAALGAVKVHYTMVYTNVQPMLHNMVPSWSGGLIL